MGCCFSRGQWPITWMGSQFRSVESLLSWGFVGRGGRLSGWSDDLDGRKFG